MKLLTGACQACLGPLPVGGSQKIVGTGLAAKHEERSDYDLVAVMVDCIDYFIILFG